ncbi:MAG: hypothetical protein R3324_21870, partial [Halobacteriales archaeon]|nr:hypothetical protein [Halobacteriales archaeon]
MVDAVPDGARDTHPDPSALVSGMGGKCLIKMGCRGEATKTTTAESGVALKIEVYTGGLLATNGYAV